MTAPDSPVQDEATRDHLTRAADWYELLFDLVFVVVIAIAVSLIEHDTSIHTVLVFVALFFPLWWAWVNLTATNNILGSRFGSLELLIILAMPGPAAMAIAIAAGMSSFDWLYATGAAWVRVVLLLMWLAPRVRGHHVVAVWRPFVYNLGTAAIWIGSLGLPVPYRYWLWLVAVAIEVALLAWRSSFADEVYRNVSVSHALERIGLFVVIVIGEAIYLTVTELSVDPTLLGGLTAFFGLVICAILARGYFRWGAPSAHAGLERARATGGYGALRDVVMYIPFLVVVGLTFVAAAIGMAVSHPNQVFGFQVKLLLVTGIALFYLANALIGLRLRRPWRQVLVFLLVGAGIPAIACLIPIASEGWVTIGLLAIALLLVEVFGLLMRRQIAKSDAPPHV